MQLSKDMHSTFLLSVGFWAPYMFGHWIIVYSQSLISEYWWLSYPGFLFLPLPILLGLCFAKAKAPGRVCDWLVAGASSLSVIGIFILISNSVLSPLYLSACFVTAAFGQIYMFFKWWGKFKETPINEVLRAVLIGVIVTSLLKILMSGMAGSFVVVVAALPIISAAMVQRIPCGEVAVRNCITPKMLKSLWRLGVAIVVFLLLWGFLDAMVAANAGHYGFSNDLSFAAQCIDIGFACIVFWFVFVYKGAIEYAQLWSYMYAVLAFSLVVLTFFGVSQIVQIFTGGSFEIAHMLILVATVDIAQRSSLPSYIPFIIAEMIYSLADWGTGSLVATLNISGLSNEVIASLFFVAIAMLVFFLPYRAPVSQYILPDLNRYIPQGDEYKRIEAGCKNLAKSHRLSERELEIMQYLCQGRSKPYIAETLYLSENTVKSYTKNLYKKLDVHSKQKLIDLVLSKAE